MPTLTESAIPRESQSIQASQVMLPSAQLMPSASQLSIPVSSEQGISTPEHMDITPEVSPLAAAFSSAGFMPPASAQSPSLTSDGDGSAENVAVSSPQVSVSVVPSTSTDSISLGNELMSPLPTDHEDLLQETVTPTPPISTPELVTSSPSISSSSGEAFRPIPVEQEGLIEESTSPTVSNSLSTVTPSFSAITPSLVESMVSVPIEQEEAGDASMAPSLRVSPSVILDSPNEALQTPIEPSFTVSVEQAEPVAASTVPDPEVSAPSITSAQATSSATYSASLSPAEMSSSGAEDTAEDSETGSPEVALSATTSPSGQATSGSEPTDGVLIGQDMSEENDITPTPSDLEPAAFSQEVSQYDTELTSSPVFGKGKENEDDETQSPEASNSAIASSSAMPLPAGNEQDEVASTPSIATPLPEITFEGEPMSGVATEQDEFVQNSIVPTPDVSSAVTSPGVQTTPLESTLPSFLPTEQPTEDDSLQPTSEIAAATTSSSSLNASPTNSEGALSAPSEQDESTEQGTSSLPVVSESAMLASPAAITPLRSPEVTATIAQEDMTTVSTEPAPEMSPSSIANFSPVASPAVEEPYPTDGGGSPVPLPSGSERPPEVTDDQEELAESSMTSLPEASATPDTSLMAHASMSGEEPFVSSVVLEENASEEDIAASDSSSLAFPSISPSAIEIPSMPSINSPEPSRDVTPSPASQTENIAVPTAEIVQATSVLSHTPDVSDGVPLESPLATMGTTDGEVSEASSTSFPRPEQEPNIPLVEESDVSTSAEPSFSGMAVTSVRPSTEANNEEEAIPTLSTPALESSSEASPQGFSPQPTFHGGNSAALPTSSFLPPGEDAPSEDELSTSLTPSLEVIPGTAGGIPPASGIASTVSTPSSELVQSATADDPSALNGSPTASDLPSPAPQSGTFSVASPSPDQHETEGSPETHSITSPELTPSPGIAMSPPEDVLSPTQSPHLEGDSFTDEVDVTLAPPSQTESPSLEFPPSPYFSSVLAEGSLAASEEAMTNENGPSATGTSLEMTFPPNVMETPKEEGLLPSMLPSREPSLVEDRPSVSQAVVPTANRTEQEQPEMGASSPGISPQSQIAETEDPYDGTGLFDGNAVLPSHSPLFSTRLPESEQPLSSQDATPPGETPHSDAPENAESGQVSPNSSLSPRPEGPSSGQMLPPDFSAQASMDIMQSDAPSPAASASVDAPSPGDNLVVPESENGRPMASPDGAAESFPPIESPLPNDMQGEPDFAEDALPSPIPLEPGLATVEESPVSNASQEPSQMGTVLSPNPSGSPLGSVAPSGTLPGNIDGPGAQPSPSATAQAEDLVFESASASPDQGLIEPSLAFVEPPEFGSAPLVTQEPGPSELTSESEGISANLGSESNPEVSPSSGAISMEVIETPVAAVFESPTSSESGSGPPPTFSPQDGSPAPSQTAETVQSSQGMEVDGDKLGESEVETPAEDENSIPTQDLVEANSSTVADMSSEPSPFRNSEPLSSVEGIDDMTSSSDDMPDVNSDEGLPSPLFETIASPSSTPGQSLLSPPADSDVSDQDTSTADPSSLLEGPSDDPSEEDLASPFAARTPDVSNSPVAESPSPFAPETLPSLLVTISPSLPSTDAEESEPVSSVILDSQGSDSVLPSTAPEDVLGDSNNGNPETSAALGGVSPSMLLSESPEASANNLNEGTTLDIQASQSPIVETITSSPVTASARATPSREGVNSSLLPSSSPGLPSSVPTPDPSMGGETLSSFPPEVSGGIIGNDAFSPSVSETSSMSGGTIVSGSPEGEEISPSPTPVVPGDTSLEPTSLVDASPSANVSQEETQPPTIGSSPGVIGVTGSPQPSESFPDESILSTPFHSPGLLADEDGGDASPLSSSEAQDGDLSDAALSLSPVPEQTDGIGASSSPGSTLEDLGDTGISHSEDMSTDESEEGELFRPSEVPTGDFDEALASQLPQPSPEEAGPITAPVLSEAPPDVFEDAAVSPSPGNVPGSFENPEVSVSIGATPVGTDDGGEPEIPEASAGDSNNAGVSQSPGLLPENGEAFESGSAAEESTVAEFSLAPEASLVEPEVSNAPTLPTASLENSAVDASPALEEPPTESDGVSLSGSSEVLPDESAAAEALPSPGVLPVASDSGEESQPSELRPEISEEADGSLSVSDEPQPFEDVTVSPLSEDESEEQSGVESPETTEFQESTGGEATPLFEVELEEPSGVQASPSFSFMPGVSLLPSPEAFPEESGENGSQSFQASPGGSEGDDLFHSPEGPPDLSNDGSVQLSFEATPEESFSQADGELQPPEAFPAESGDVEIPTASPSVTPIASLDASSDNDPDFANPSEASPEDVDGTSDQLLEPSATSILSESENSSPSPASSSLDGSSGSPSPVDASPELFFSPTLFPSEGSSVPPLPPSNGGPISPDESVAPVETELVEASHQSISPSPFLASASVTGPIEMSISISPSLSPSLSESPGPARAFPPGAGSGASPALESLANADAPQGAGTDPGVSETGGLPGGVGGVSGIAIGAFLVVAIVGSVVYKSCAVFPGGAGFGITSIFGSSDDGDGGHGSARYDGLGDDSPWDQVWRSASELPERVVAAGEAAAALVGGEFAGIFKPGAARVRPPQVITRLAVPGMCMALSQLSPGSVGSEVFSSVSGHSSESKSFRSSRFPSSPGSLEVSGSVNAGDREKKKVAGGACPKVDLLFVFDASGSLSWRDYRSLKEILTKPGGLIDTVIRRAGNGSRIGFIEYAYDSVVVSELDRDEESVRRRILSSFQGDANNWDRSGMYIYEVGEDAGGNALRKVDSLVQRNKKDEMQDEESIEGGSGDIEEPPTVQAKEVPPAMNGMSREAHLALKWCRFEMLPPVANRRIQEQLQNALRLRRVVVVNAGELTKGGQSDMGMEAALEEKREMEKLGIRILTVGIGEEHEKDLSKLATGKSHLSAASVEGAEQLVKKLGDMILKMNAKYDGKISRNPPAIVKRKRKKRDRSAREKRQQAVYRAVQAGAIDPAKSISKGLPRRASELPPWFTQ